MALLRKKKSTFDESDMPTDGWIWGNTRGGGGAPLKDVQGNDVANLKKVLAGTVEVDHSPSPNSKGRNNKQGFRNNDYDDNSGYNQKQNQRNNFDHNIPSGNTNYRNRKNYDQDDDDDDHYDQRGGRNSNGNNRNNSNNQAANINYNNDHQQQQQKADPRNKPQQRFNPYSDEAPQRGIPGLNMQVNQNDPNSPRHVHNNNGASPKKFMGALRELTGSNADRDSKQRKQAEYQEMLRQQIEDNNRKKDKEKKEKDDQKKRELAEFHAQMGGAKNNTKAAAPAASVPRFRADSGDQYNSENDDHSYGHNHNNHKPHHGMNGNNRNSSNRNNSDDGHSRNGNGGGYQGGGGSSNNNNNIPGLGGNKGVALNLPVRRVGSSYSDPDDEENDEPPARRNNNQGGGRSGGGGSNHNHNHSGGGGGHRGRANSYDSDPEPNSDPIDNTRSGIRGRGKDKAVGASDDVVPVEEYDELSKLVDRLITEKAQLQLNLEKQADLLKALKAGSKAAAPARGRLANSPTKPPTIARSRSAIQPNRGGAGGADRGGAGGAAAEAETAPRAASNLRTSKKEMDRERALQQKQALKAYEPINKNAKNAAVNLKQRPSSMHAMGVDDAGGPKKAGKVAFGSNKALDKNNVGGSKLAQQGAAVVGGGARGGRKTAAAESPNDTTGAGRYSQLKPTRGGPDNSRDNLGVNGFAKLAQANSRVVGGPMMVVHDEEEMPGHSHHRYDNARTPSPLRGGGGGGGGRGYDRRGNNSSSASELRGNSDFLPVSDNNMIGGDQLEKLLRQSRNAR